jgi:hypothetical protein
MTCGVSSDSRFSVDRRCRPELERRISQMLLHDSRPGKEDFLRGLAVECSLFRVSIATDTDQTVARDKSRPRLFSLNSS